MNNNNLTCLHILVHNSLNGIEIYCNIKSQNDNFPCNNNTNIHTFIHRVAYKSIDQFDKFNHIKVIIIIMH